MSTSQNDQEDILFETVNNKGVWTLNKPRNLNALTLSMLRMICPRLLAWQDEVDFAIVRSNSDKAFSAGGDVVAVTEAGKQDPVKALQFFYEEYRINNMLRNYRIPHVALIHGITMGGGVGISIHGQYRVATEKTLFAMPETLIGLIPDVGGTHFLPRLKGNLGTYLGLTGQRLKGYDVLRAEIATHFCDSDKLGDLQKELIALNGSSELEPVLEKYTEMSTHCDADSSILLPYLDKIDSLFSKDTIEEVLADLERDASDWALKQRDVLHKMSPTSLKLTIRMIREGKHLSMQQVLKKEYDVVQHILYNHDFYEGVRAVLIDKDNAPKWQPSRLEDVTDELINSYFVPGAKALEF